MRKWARKAARAGYRGAARLTSRLDGLFLHDDVPLAELVSHSRWPDYLPEIANKPGLRVLEVGSREVTWAPAYRGAFDQAEYVGFDIYPGDNVDVVGDAHRLTEYFTEPFDLIFSSAVFEHLAMPWIAATEMVKLLKVGGHVFVETHFSYSSHERPWHFFQYSDMALRVLFSPALGIECIEAGVSNPLIGRFSAKADEYLRYEPVRGIYCHTEFLGRKVRDVPAFDWNDVDLADVVGGTAYPAPIKSTPSVHKDGSERLRTPLTSDSGSSEMGGV